MIKAENLIVEEALSDSLSFITVIGPDLSDGEKDEIIKRAYISSLAVKDFVAGELDLESFLDIQEYCLTEQSMDNYLDIVDSNIRSLSFAELLTN